MRYHKPDMGMNPPGTKFSTANQRGAVSLEAAIIFPVFFLFIFIAISFGLIVAKWILVDEALNSAAYASIRSSEIQASTACKGIADAEFKNQLANLPDIISVSNPALTAQASEGFGGLLPAVTYTGSTDIDCLFCSYLIPGGKLRSSIKLTGNPWALNCGDLDP